MAETGRPLLELFPPGGTIPCDSAFPNVPVLPVSKSSAELAKAPLQPEEFQKSSDKVPRSENVLEDSSHIKANTTMHVTSCVVERLAVRSVAYPHSIAEVHTPDGAGALRGDSLTHETEQGFGSHTSFLHRDRGEQIAAPAKPPARSSPSDRSPASAPHCETHGTARPGTGPEASVQSLSCEQTMQLHQSSSAFCPPGIICPAQHGCPRSARTGPQAAGELSGYPKHSGLEEAICCGSYPHVVIEDTFAAYCHPQPIPAPAQLLLQKAPPEGCKGQGGGPPLLALPPLVSSVSETGLDGKHLLHCCKLDCNWPGPQQRVGAKATRDVATMTPRTELRDAGVQVGQEHPERQARHVFPKVCLVDEGPAARRKSPVREVKWDAEGMTWEVYGASVDPEELGLAIQKHLELQIKETAGRAAKLSRQSTITSHTSAGKGRRRRRSLMTALHPPGCCTRTTTAAD